MSTGSLADDRKSMTITAYFDLHGTMRPLDNHTWPQAILQNHYYYYYIHIILVNVVGSNSRKNNCASVTLLKYQTIVITERSLRKSNHEVLIMHYEDGS